MTNCHFHYVLLICRLFYWCNAWNYGRAGCCITLHFDLSSELSEDENNNKHFLFISALGQNSLSWSAQQIQQLSRLNTCTISMSEQGKNSLDQNFTVPQWWIDEIQKMVPSKNTAAIEQLPQSVCAQNTCQITRSGRLIQQNHKYINVFYPTTPRIGLSSWLLYGGKG